MKICGVVAEYNPFHNGHAFHLAETRARLGADTAIIAVMSGNYVQRGDFGVIGKYRRAAMAAQNGADLVIELPLSAVLSSAEGFAAGAIGMLGALGCVTHLSFGSECGDLDLLRRAAELSIDRGAIRARMSAGQSFAAALQAAVSARDPEAGAVFSSPNNTLAVEYLAALARHGSPIEPLTIRRAGAAHDSDAPDALPSASFVRARILSGDLSACRRVMPPAAFAVLSAALTCGAAPVHAAACDRAIVAHLRRMSAADLYLYITGEDGLQNRLYQAIQSNGTFAAICEAAQTRRYPLARIRRALLRAYIDLPGSMDVAPHYLRVLALGPRGRELLRLIGQTSSLPVIVKPAVERGLPDAVQPYLAHDVLSDDLFALAQPNPDLHVGGGHYRKTPFCVPEIRA